ncbi:MAG: AAA+ family ATPase [Gemmobacter sp.]|jgi:hypothetical protein|nr:AAA+ family ATPase [Gemmobacter sp.]
MRWTLVALSLMLAAPAPAQERAAPPSDLSQGFDLLGEGARLLFRGLMSEMEPALQEMGEQLRAMEPVLRSLAEMIGDIRNYEAPVKLPNGDIILRRKPDPASDEEATGEVEL